MRLKLIENEKNLAYLLRMDGRLRVIVSAYQKSKTSHMVKTVGAYPCSKLAALTCESPLNNGWHPSPTTHQTKHQPELNS